MLRYVTRKNSSPQDMPNVFFVAHPEEKDKYFSSVARQIIEYVDCAVWYADEDYNAEFYEQLKDMQLFVMAVTTKMLLTENEALSVYFKIATENNIPVLPILKEEGIERTFNIKCGDLQFLSESYDPTAIDYEEKLKRYLQTVLVGDQLKARIRSAFDAYVFLSYRKKDRKYANQLMRLIHKNPFCRDVAIWYDEYLTPGENFNDSIKAALKKSDLFVMAVTPNLINEDNYVMREEYPMAKQENKPVLPCELVPTDRSVLKEKYEGIPEVTDAYNDEALSQSLIKNLERIAKKENDDSPVHNYFIGLAYLDGIDVEVDRERGAELIRSAASSGLEEAMESLMNMYLTGKGVARDGKEAARWKEKLNEALYLRVSRGAENVKNTQDAIKKEAASRSGASTMEELEVSYQRTRSLRFLRSNVEAIIKNWYEEQLELSKMYFAAGDSGNGERVILETLKFAKDNKEYFPISLAPKGMIGDENSNIDTSYYDLNIMLVDCFVKAQRLEFAHEHLKKTKEWLDRIQANSTQKNIKIIKYSLEAKLAEVLYSMGDFEEAYRIISASATEYVEFIRESVVKGKVEAVNELQIIKGEAIEFIAAVDELYAVLCGQFALLGEVTLKLKKYGEAKNAFNEAVAANERAGRKKKKSIEVRCRLDMIDALIGLNEDTEECFRQAERAIAFLDEDTIEVSFLKAKILLKRGDVAAQKNKAEARAYYQMALAIAQRLEKDAPSKEHIELLNELKEKD